MLPVTGIFIIIAMVVVVFVILSPLVQLWTHSGDRARERPRDRLPKEFDKPQYCRLTADEKRVDLEARWPGWDGWYFFGFPDEPAGGLQMIRASLMTGLYGLEGIDDYEKLELRLSTFDVVECLSLLPTSDGNMSSVSPLINEAVRNNLSQLYLPRKTSLALAPHVCDIAVKGAKPGADEEEQTYGRIRGQWPSYSLAFFNPEAEIEFELNYTADELIWWVDIPRLFTYYVSFGRFSGSVIFHREHIPAVGAGDAERLPLLIHGRGGFEHGFARKPFGFDALWRPVRYLQAHMPNLHPIRYHYELILSEQGVRGGFMVAKAFGLGIQRRGAFYWNGVYHEVRRLRVEYDGEVPSDQVIHHCAPGRVVAFPRRWHVEAETDQGTLSYTAQRLMPPATIASAMMYYHIEFTGTCFGVSVSGRGYGEYVHL